MVAAPGRGHLQGMNTYAALSLDTSLGREQGKEIKESVKVNALKASQSLLHIVSDITWLHMCVL